MKRVILITLIVLTFLTVAGTYRRDYPISGMSGPYTILTTSQTTITLPFPAKHSWIINRGSSNVAYRFDAQTVVPANCCVLKPGEALQNVDIPFASISFLAITQSGSIELIVSY